ncbi:MAG: sterol desaturase family protein, partial [Gemmatimonadetes bacterium]|nr:sterol desaturase family protein [Gemmatimonadota bacterium]
MKQTTNRAAGAGGAVHDAPQQRRRIPRLVAAAVVCTLAIVAWKIAGSPGFTAMHRSPLGITLKEWTYWPAYNLVVDTIVHPLFWILFGGILVLEKLFPARREQKVLSGSFAQDLVWFFFSTTIGVTLIGIYVTLLRDFYADHLAFLTVEPLRSLPSWARFAWGALFTDFLRWFHHWIRHVVPVFWHFHAVHHSQKQLNMFTQFRYHILEYIIAHTVSTIPLLMFSLDMPVIIAWNVFHMWFTRFYHANIRMNLGPLRYVFVTPQS